MTLWFGRAVDVLAFLYAVLYLPAPVFWLIIHPAIHFWRRFGNRSFWVALPVWLASAVVLVLLRHRVFGERIHRSVFTAVIGAALVAFGFWLGERVHRDFGWCRLGGLPEVNPARYQGGVVDWGVYARVRHPRYLHYMLSFAGFAFLTGARGIFVLAIATVLMYLIVAPLEERELREHYGEEYDAYTRAVPRFLPRLRQKA